MTIRVLVADDQSWSAPAFACFSPEAGHRGGRRSGNGLEAVAKAARYHPTVVLMDIRMPELDGLEATRRILADDTTARILILTTFDLDEYVYEALRIGASGFVLKTILQSSCSPPSAPSRAETHCFRRRSRNA